MLLFIVVPAIQTIRWVWIPFDAEKVDAFQRQYFQTMHTGHLIQIMKCNYQAADLFFLQRYAQLRDMAETLAKFLFGYYILRKSYFSPTPSITWMKKTWKVSLPVALVYMAEHSYLLFSHAVPKALPLKITLFIFDKAGILCLSTVYALFIAVLYQRYAKAFLFRCLESIGKMSLTNYLTHTLFYVFIYYGLGLGLLGSIHLQWTLPIAIFIYTLQVAFSTIWLKWMLYGPAEWIWRQVTYGKWLGLRKR